MCNDGYKLVGSPRNRCQRDGSWRYGGENLPVCTQGEVLIIIELVTNSARSLSDFNVTFTLIKIEPYLNNTLFK